MLADTSGWEVGGDGGLGQDEKCCGWAEGPVLGRLVRGRKWDLGMKKWGKKVEEEDRWENQIGIRGPGE